MNETKLSDNVFEQIKDFDHEKLTKEQESLIDKLILNEELKEYYKNYGLCKECKRPHTIINWCQSCNGKHFQQNFQNWTSGNRDIDVFIQSVQLNAKTNGEVLEWIEFDGFENVEHMTEGGLGTTYKAIWKNGHIFRWDSENKQWSRYGDMMVALKCLHDSKDVIEFLREIEKHVIMNYSPNVISCYGITKDPESKNFMMVMNYAINGSLRQYLNNGFNSMKWDEKLDILLKIASGLNNFHENRLVHHNFHSGNISNGFNNHTYITGFGLSQPENVVPSQSVYAYGVLPYVAPEALREKNYTQASDIYGFGIIAYEVCTGLPPYHDMSHDESLAIRICQGLRPNSSYKIPQLILDIIKKCWDANSLNRPKAAELCVSLKDLYENADEKNSLIYKQINEANEINKQLLASKSSSDVLSYVTHPEAVYTSRLLDFKNLPESKNANDNE